MWPAGVAGGLVLDGLQPRALDSGAPTAPACDSACGLSGDGSTLVTVTKLAGPPCAYVVARRARGGGGLLWNVTAGGAPGGGGACAAGWGDYSAPGALVPTTVQLYGTRTGPGAAAVLAVLWHSSPSAADDLFIVGLDPASGGVLCAGVSGLAGCAWVQPSVMLCEDVNNGPGIHESGAYTLSGGAGGVVAQVEYYVDSATRVDPTGRYYGVVECNNGGCHSLTVYGPMPALAPLLSVDIPSDEMACSDFVWSPDGSHVVLQSPDGAAAQGSVLLQAFALAAGATPSTPLWSRTFAGSCGVPLAGGDGTLLVALPGTPTSVSVLALATGATLEQIDLGVVITALTCSSALRGRVYASAGASVIAVDYV